MWFGANNRGYTPAQTGGSGFYPAGHWVPAQQAMIQVYPRPNSETSTFARHRWAYYDGVNPVQYIIPIGVSFGAFPFVYQLLSGPPGMTIGQAYGSTNYGIITWTPTASVTNSTVQVLVTDQQLNTLTITWTVSTSSSTSQFIFVDSVHGSDSNTGTIGSPFASVTKAFGSTFSANANASAICYLRNGTYTGLPVYTDNDIGPPGTNFFEMSVTRKPCALVGFPGETVTLDMSNTNFAANGDGQDFFMQNLNPNSGRSTDGSYRWFSMTGIGGNARMCFDAISWTNAIYGTTGNDNATMFYSTNGGGSLRQYLFLNRCSETGRPSGRTGNNYAGCSLYAWQYALVRGFTTTPAGQVDGNLYFKIDEFDSEMRECFTTQAGGGHCCSIGGFQNLNPTRNLIRHNKCISQSDSVNLCLGHDGSGTTFNILWCVRNNLIGQYFCVDPTQGGPYVFDSNMAQFSGTAYPTGAAVQTDGNNQAVTSGGLDTTTCNLIGASRTSFLGLVGAEIA